MTPPPHHDHTLAAPPHRWIRPAACVGVLAVTLGLAGPAVAAPDGRAEAEGPVARVVQHPQPAVTLNDLTMVSPVAPTRVGRTNSIKIPNVKGITYALDPLAANPVSGTLDLAARGWSDVDLYAVADQGYFFPDVGPPITFPHLGPETTWHFVQVRDTDEIVPLVAPTRAGNQLAIPAAKDAIYTTRDEQVAGIVTITPEHTAESPLRVQARVADEKNQVFPEGLSWSDYWDYHYIDDESTLVTPMVPHIPNPLDYGNRCAIDPRIDSAAIATYIDPPRTSSTWEPIDFGPLILDQGATFTIMKAPVAGYAFPEGTTAAWTFTCTRDGLMPDPDPGPGAGPGSKPRNPIPADDGSSTRDIDDGGIGGSGNTFFLNDTFGPYANTVFNFGNTGGRFYVGDWDGDGQDTLAYRIGRTFYVADSNADGTAVEVIHYGRPGDRVYVGDWNGDGRDTLAVRRGKTYHVKNSMSGGDADHVIRYGRAGDDILVGDWNGDGRDTFAVRRGKTYHVKNSMSGGAADRAFPYGRAGDQVLVGDWNGDGKDTFTVRRGKQYFVKNSISGGDADSVLFYGRAKDTTLVGDWNGDRRDTLGVRRP